ncbi:MAG: HD domain-containing protein [Candidatus Margulisbacteria bacterium]|nr:HD domain-containing protein [Candidatus Margulisiibacteriota bacterium]
MKVNLLRTLGQKAIRLGASASPRSILSSEFGRELSEILDIVNRSRVEQFAQGQFDEHKFLRAARICAAEHEGQMRNSGVKYAYHPIEVCKRLAKDYHINDQNVLIAALLHDVVEDAKYPLSRIEKEFGSTVALLVDGMTKIEQLDIDRTINEENINKFITLLSRDVRLLLIKMVDRGVNLLDQEPVISESGRKNAIEALDFYVPLARLVGFWKAASHLADLAFQKIYPERYLLGREMIAKSKEKNAGLLAEIEKKIRDRYREMLKKEVYKDGILSDLAIENKVRQIEIRFHSPTPQEIDSITAARLLHITDFKDVAMIQIITPERVDCHQMVYVLSCLAEPIDSLSRDYIGDPKINHYEALHRGNLFGDETIRVQIRTQRMQETAMYGESSLTYDTSGNFVQPDLPALHPVNLRRILRAETRYDKMQIALGTENIKKAKVYFEVEGKEIIRDIMAPHDITPLEMAILADPAMAMRLFSVIHNGYRYDIEGHRIKRPTRLFVSLTKEFVPRDYFATVKNPLARADLLEWLNSLSSEERKERFSTPLLKAVLSKYFMDHDLVRTYLFDEVERALAGIGSGKLSMKVAGIALNQASQHLEIPPVDIYKLILNADSYELRKRIEDMLETCFRLHSKTLLPDGQLHASLIMANPIQTDRLKKMMKRLDNERGLAITTRYPH